MEEDKKVEQIEHMLTQWVTAVKLRNARGYTDINRTSENLALRLLNAVYGYRLENLNWTSPDYPAADLGDRHEGIAFQVTATTTAAKIRQSLEKFHSPSGPHRQFFGGLYFFFITGKTPSITKKVKDDLQEKYSGFHFDSRMIAIDRLLRQVQQLYSTDPRRFDQVETILNKEFGYRKEKVGRRELLEELFCGSKRYLESLRGRGGRFRNLIISDTLLSPSRREEPKENPWLDTPVTVDGKIRSPSENPEASLRVSDAVPKLWAPAQALQNKNASPRSGCGHALLKGEGGMGKTVSLIRLWERYTETGVFNPMLPVPVFIPLNEYNELKSGTSRKDFIQGLIRKFYLKAETRGVELLDVLGEPFNAGHSDAPSVILLLDGLNEVTVERTQLEVNCGRYWSTGRACRLWSPAGWICVTLWAGPVFTSSNCWAWKRRKLRSI
ncbi:MAG: SMEK domain-containing protein [bacterium]|nr:SMEK domain-containing protein [bacterium]